CASTRPSSSHAAPPSTDTLTSAVVASSRGTRSVHEISTGAPAPASSVYEGAPSQKGATTPTIPVTIAVAPFVLRSRNARGPGSAALSTLQKTSISPPLSVTL